MPALEPIHVVFIHGLFSSAKAWTTVKSLIAADTELPSFVTIDCFEYNSPPFRVRPDRRIAEIDDVADRLRTYLLRELDDTKPIVLVTHSQGGLIVQRFLARMIWHGEARDLTRIKQIVMYSCPNSGSEFFLSVRKRAFFWRHPQERQLRPFNRVVTEAQETVLRAIVNAHGCSDTECHIPIVACGGTTDRIVPPVIAGWVFPSREIVDGDHFSIIRPNSPGASSFRVLKRTLLAVGKPKADSAAYPPDAPSERPGRVSVAPPFGRRDTKLQGRSKLVASVMNDPASKVSILAGPGGSGKSRLALEVAFRARDAGRRVWWVQLTQLNSCMREIANQVGASESQIELAWRGKGSPTDLVWRFLNDHPEPWLIVFDNADDPQLLGPLDGRVSDGTGWLRVPETDNGTVIVTSRDRNTATWGDGSVMHLVPPLNIENGAAMLMERTANEGGTREEARQLSAELGGLPLALRAAADYVKSVSHTGIGRSRPD